MNRLSSLCLLLLCCLLAANSATAQSSKDKLSRKEQKLVVASQTQIENRQFRAAERSLDELIESRPNNAEIYYLRSIVKTSMYRYDDAVEDIERGMAISGRTNGRALEEKGNLLSKAGRFQEAVDAFRQALAIRESTGKGKQIAKAKRKLRYAEIADSLARNPVPFSPSPVAGLVNTTAHFEYHPTLSTDGQQLIFTRRVDRKQEDFYVSQLLSDSTWGEAKPLPGINTPYDEGAQTVTADGKYMVYTSCNSPGNARGCDLYEAYWLQNAWSPGRRINSANINTPHYEAQPSLSRDGRYLLFSSKRPGGKGGADLYLSGRLADGTWSNPINLRALNTAGNEQYPFWAADGSTLYFTSDGLPGIGGDDLFLTRLQPDNSFAVPKNLGYPINTADNETNMFIPLAGETAYFSKRYFDADRGMMQIDLFQFPLPPHLRPRPATYVRARVTDMANQQPLKANISVQAIDGMLPELTAQTAADGTFLTTLTSGRAYAFIVDKPGYLFHSERFEPSAEASPERPYVVNIELHAITPDPSPATREEDGSTAFKNVLFATGSADLLEVSKTELNRLVDVLSEAPTLRVRISGHTDNVGSDTDNLRLSQDRAASVSQYLIAAGVAAERIDPVGYGESKPIADNDTPAGRAANRRTTFLLLR